MGILAKLAMRGMAPFTGPVSLTVNVCYAGGTGPHDRRPDLDNIIKSVKDGLNGVAYHDDSQVWRVTATKVWGEKDETTVEVRSARGTGEGGHGE